MSALNLPKPVNTYAGEDELRNNGTGPNGAGGGVNGTNGTVEEVEDEGEYVAPKPSDRFKVGLIYPPREIRSEWIVCGFGVKDELKGRYHRQDGLGDFKITYTSSPRRENQRSSKGRFEIRFYAGGRSFSSIL